MATARCEVQTVEKVVKTQEEVVVLTLTPEEARAILTLTHNVGGNGPKRDLTNNVSRALATTGVWAYAADSMGYRYFKFEGE